MGYNLQIFKLLGMMSNYDISLKFDFNSTLYFLFNACNSSSAFTLMYRIALYNYHNYI